MTDLGENNVSVISHALNTVVVTIPVGQTPRAIAFDSGRGEISSPTRCQAT